MAYSCCFSLGGNLDFTDFLQKQFYNINFWIRATRNESIQWTLRIQNLTRSSFSELVQLMWLDWAILTKKIRTKKPKYVTPYTISSVKPIINYLLTETISVEVQLLLKKASRLDNVSCVFLACHTTVANLINNLRS